jgi:hypothetical protein
MRKYPLIVILLSALALSACGGGTTTVIQKGQPGTTGVSTVAVDQWGLTAAQERFTKRSIEDSKNDRLRRLVCFGSQSRTEWAHRWGHFDGISGFQEYDYITDNYC